MVNAVSTTGQFNYIQDMLQTTQSSLNTVQEQLSSGRIADTYAGLGGSNTYQSLSLRAENSQLDAYNTAIDNVLPITSSMDSAMSDMTTSAQTVSSALTAAVQGNSDPGMTLFNQQAQSALTATQQALNTQTDGVSVFAASDSGNPPVANTTALNTAVGTDLSAFYAGTETAAQVLANVQAYTPAQMGYSSTLAAATNVSVPTANGVQTDYTVKADNSGFQKLQQGLAIIANLKYTPTNEAGFYQLYNGALQLINSGQSAITQNQSTLGVSTKTMTDAQTTIAATQTVLNTGITGAEDLSAADTAKASTELSTLESQLQTSYTIVGQLQNLHLVDYLNGTA